MINWPEDPYYFDYTFLQLKKTKYVPIKSTFPLNTFFISKNIEKTVRSEKDINNLNRDHADESY
jgi:hypothetical protein